MSNIPLEQGDFERQVEFDFLRATESAALNTLQWLGKGQKEKADEAACDAIRGTLDLVNICGEVVIGEGIKDNRQVCSKEKRSEVGKMDRRDSRSR